jgi:Ubiquitin carboxyl-terminal hydrolase
VKGYDFRIYAIVVHSGSSASHGHYYALVNTENGLMKLDDNMVVANSAQLGQTDTPYILFYQRKDCRADDQDVSFEQLDASLKGFVKAYRGRNRFGWTGSNYKRPQPPPPPEPPSSCGDGPSLSSNRMIF